MCCRSCLLCRHLANCIATPCYEPRVSVLFQKPRLKLDFITESERAEFSLFGDVVCSSVGAALIHIWLDWVCWLLSIRSKRFQRLFCFPPANKIGQIREKVEVCGWYFVPRLNSGAGTGLVRRAWLVGRVRRVSFVLQRVVGLAVTGGDGEAKAGGLTLAALHLWSIGRWGFWRWPKRYVGLGVGGGRLLTRGVEVASQEGELISCPLSEAKKRGVVERGGKWKFWIVKSHCEINCQ